MNWTWKEIGTAGLLLVALLALWMNRYRYEHDRQDNIVRIHRVTGEAEWLTPGDGWVSPQDEEDTD